MPQRFLELVKYIQQCSSYLANALQPIFLGTPHMSKPGATVPNALTTRPDQRCCYSLRSALIKQPDLQSAYSEESNVAPILVRRRIRPSRMRAHKSFPYARSRKGDVLAELKTADQGGVWERRLAVRFGPRGLNGGRPL